MRVDFRGYGEVFRRAEDACVVADVAAEEDKGVWVGGCACEPAEVADSVTGAVEEVEGAVAKVVEGGELADFEGAVEGDFTEVPSAVEIILECTAKEGKGGLTYNRFQAAGSLDSQDNQGA